MRACSSGREDGVSSSTIASRGRRSASACRTWPARSGSPGGGGSGTLRSGGARARLDELRERQADGAGIAEHGDVDGAAVCLLGVLRDHREPGSGVHERALVVRVLAERAGADDQHRVVGRERLPQPRAARRQVTGEQRVVLREARRAAERLLEHGAVQAARRASEAAAVPVRAGPGDDRGRTVERAPPARRRRPDRRRRERSSRCGPSTSCGSGASAVQSSIGTITSAGPRPVTRLVIGTDDRARDVLRARRLGRMHRVVAGEAVQAPGQERLLREVAAILLADDHDQRRAVGARGGDRRDGVPEPRRRVQQRQCRARRARARTRPPSRRPSPRAAPART